MNTALNAMKESFLKEIVGVPLDVISVKEEARDKLDDKKNPIGVDEYVKIGVEIPKGNGVLSRLRFEVKIPDGALKVKQEQLDESDWIVQFDDLTISYIDTVHGNVYFKAADYEVQEVE